MPNPYLILVAVLALGGAFIGGYLKGGADTGARWEAATERLKAEAAATLAVETAKAAAADARNAELARTIEETHAQAVKDAASRGADFDRRLRLAASRVGRCGPAAAAAIDPGRGSDPAGRGDPGLGGVSPEAIRAVRDYGLELQRYAVACHSWALEVGR